VSKSLVLRGPTFWSEGDEKAFFDWLQSVSCVASVEGRLRDLNIRLKRKPSAANVRELEAIVRRYRMNAKSLQEFVEETSK
jgi:hypothetical protein